MRRSCFALLVLALPACSGDDPKSKPGEPGGTGVLLGDGTRVSLDAGGLTLDRAGRRVFSLTRGPALHAYDETVIQGIAAWDFVRENEVLTTFDAAPTLAESEGSASLTYTKGEAQARWLVAPLRDGAVLVTLSVIGDDTRKAISLPFSCEAEASFFGFGEQYNATDQRGEAFPLFVSEQGIGRTGTTPSALQGTKHTTYFPMPYFLDARGFGVLARTTQRTSVDLCQTDPAVAKLDVEDRGPVQFVVFTGPTPYDVIRQLGDEVGRPKGLPSWAFEPWISAQGGRDAVLARVAALEAAGIRAGAIWSQDWTGKRTNIGGGSGVQYRWVADEAFYPDLAGMIRGLHDKGYKFLAYANPFVMPNLDHFAEMDAQRLLAQKQDGSTYLHVSPAGNAASPDFSRPETRAYVKQQLAAMIDLGIDGWMADFAEYLPIDTAPADGGDPRAAHNRYPEAWHRVCREVLDEKKGDDYALFSRSGFTGDQRVAQITWVGDQEVTFSETDGLPTVVPAMLNLGLSGQPNVTHDIAGFSGGPSEKELYLRWTELGAFTPIFRTHDGNKKDENWWWGKDVETTAHFKRMTEIHRVLAPEFEALARDAELSSKPILRHLMLEFPEDAEARRVSDQFLIGDSLLVAPVLKKGATTRGVYLPVGDWYSVWDGSKQAGGQRIDVPAPIGKPPVFSRGAARTDLSGI